MMNINELVSAVNKRRAEGIHAPINTISPGPNQVVVEAPPIDAGGGFGDPFQISTGGPFQARALLPALETARDTILDSIDKPSSTFESIRSTLADFMGEDPAPAPVQPFAIAPPIDLPAEEPVPVEPQIIPPPAPIEPVALPEVESAPTPDDIIAQVDATADEVGIPSILFRNLIKQESGFNPKAVGDQGDSIGLGQVQKAAFKEVFPKGDRFNPKDNLKASALYLQKQVNAGRKRGYDDEVSYKLGLAGYNAGPGKLNQAINKAKKATKSDQPGFDEIKKHLPASTRSYVDSIADDQPDLYDYVEAGGNRLLSGIIGFPKSVLNLIELTGNLVSDDFQATTAGKAVRNLQDNFFGKSQEILYENLPARFKNKLDENEGFLPNQEQLFSSFFELLPQLPGMFSLGSGATKLAGALGAGQKLAAGTGAVTAGTTFSTAEVYSSTLEDARLTLASQNIPNDQKEKIAQRTAFYATSINALPTAALSALGLSKAFMTKGNIFKRAFDGAKADIIPEGIQEAVEGAAQDFAVKENIDPEREVITGEALKRRSKETVIGGTLGAVTGSAIGALNDAPVEAGSVPIETKVPETPKGADKEAVEDIPHPAEAIALEEAKAPEPVKPTNAEEAKETADPKIVENVDPVTPIDKKEGEAQEVVDSPEPRELEGEILAPNGKASKLTKKQQEVAKSPEFKKEFGEWEGVARATMPRQAKKLSEAREVALDFVGEPLTNKETGLEAVVSGRSVKKMTSASAVEKSVSPEAHSLAVGNVDHLFSNATLNETHADRNNDENIENIQRYFAPMIFNEETFKVKLTVKEMKNLGQQNPIYSVEAIEIEKEPAPMAPSGEGIEQTDPAVSQGSRASVTTAGSNPSNIDQEFAKINPALAKNLDENGEPSIEAIERFQKTGVTVEPEEDSGADSTNPIANEGGFLVPDIFKSVTDVVRKDPTADKVLKAHEETAKEIQDHKSIIKNPKRFTAQLKRSFVDVSGNIKQKLIKEGGVAGQAVVMKHDLIAGSSAESKRQFAEFSNKIQIQDLSKKEVDLFHFMAESRRVIAIDKHRAEKGLDPVKHPRGLTGDQHQKFLDSIPKKIRKRLDQKLEHVFSTTRDQLKLLHKNGLLTDKQFKELDGAGDYIPRRFIQHIDPERSFDFGEGRKITVRDSGIKSLEHGSEEALEKDVQLLVADVIARTQARIFRNNANKELYNFATENPGNGIAEAREARSTEEQIFVVIDGEPQPIAMPRELAREWVERDPAISSSLKETIGWISGAKILRATATGYNPEFALTNIPRDMAHIMFTTEEFSDHLPIGFAQLVKNMVKVLPDAIGRKGRFTDYIKEGGGMDFLTSQGQTAGNISGKLEKVDTVLGYLGMTSELVTRLALREQAIINGKSKEEATWAARNYLDFSQGGSVAKALDSGIPYLNASIQGTRGIFRAARRNPGVFSYKVAQLGTFSMLLYMANTLTNDEDWDNIPDHEKAGNFIITTPLFEIDKDGNKRPFYLRIAKDQGQRAISSVFENLMAVYLGHGVNMEQIEIAVKDGLPVIPGSELPPSVDAFLSYTTNTDFWRNEEVWKGPKVNPEAEVKPWTHPAFVKAGEATGTSPVRLRHSVTQFFANSNPLMDVVGWSTRLLFDDLPEAKQREFIDRVNYDLPFLRRFFRVGRPYNVEERKRLKKAQLDFQTKAFKENRDFQGLLNDFEKTRNKGAIIEFIRKIEPARRKNFNKKFKAWEKTRSIGPIQERQWWLQLSGMNPEARAASYWAAWVSADAEKRKRLDRDLLKVPGVNTARFKAKLRNLKKEK